MESDLNATERQSSTWKKIKNKAEERLAGLRIRNDANLSEADTAKLRGQIAELKFLLALGEDPGPAITLDADE